MSETFGWISLEVISPLQQRILALFPSLTDSAQFYLTGGTALAHFYLKHRRSRDLDFFTSLEEMIVPFSVRLEKRLGQEGFSVRKQRGTRTFIELWIEKEKQSTIIQFAQDSPFRFEPAREFQEFPGLKVDSLKDIASNKLLALFGRAALRDFVDLYYLVKKAGFSKSDLIRDSQKKDPGFDLYWFGVALDRIKTYEKDSAEMLLLLEPVDFKELLSFFDQWREDIVQELKP